MKDIIYKCVTRNIYFEGLLGTRYTIQELFDNSLHVDTIKNLANTFNHRLYKLGVLDLFGDEKSKKQRNLLQFKVTALMEVVKFKNEQKETLKRRNSLYKLKQERIELLKGVKFDKTKKEIEDRSIEQIDQEIADLT